MLKKEDINYTLLEAIKSIDGCSVDRIIDYYKQKYPENDFIIQRNITDNDSALKKLILAGYVMEDNGILRVINI